MASSRDIIENLQRSFGGGTADVDYWSGQLEKGQDINSLMKNMVGLGTEQNPIGEGNSGEIITKLQGAFGGNPEDTDYWTGKLSKGQDLNSLLKNMSGYESPGLTGEPAGGTGSSFDVPTDVYPKSESQSSSVSTSGIDWSSPMMQKIMNQLSGKVDTMESDIDKYSKSINDQYKALIQSTLGPEALQSTFEDLGARNMMDSSFAKDATSQVVSNLIKEIMNKQYESQTAAQGLKLNIPEILGKLASLGQKSTSASQSTSLNENRLAPYELMANIIMNQ